MEKEPNQEELKKQFNKINGVQKEHEDVLKRHPEFKAAIQEYQTSLAVLMAHSWLPRDLTRRLIMLVVFIVGISGAIAGNYKWLFILLILPFFSPRIILKIAIIIGYLKGNHNK